MHRSVNFLPSLPVQSISCPDSFHCPVSGATLRMLHEASPTLCLAS